MEGKKASVIDNVAKKNNINLIKLNYLGHGTSSGKVVDFTMSDWFANIKTIIDKFSNNKKLLFIGSSMGGWFSYLMALEYKDRVKAIFTFSTAIDFLTEVMEPQIKEEDKNKDIVFEIVNPDGSRNGIFITRKLWQDSKKFNLFNKDKVEINCPIRMLHGQKDILIPYETALKFTKKLTSEDLQLILVKNMDHRLLLENNLKILEDSINEFLSKI